MNPWNSVESMYDQIKAVLQAHVASKLYWASGHHALAHLFFFKKENVSTLLK